MSVDVASIALHKSFECDLRPVPCKYCEAPFPERKLRSHEEYCGSRTDACGLCGRMVVSKRMAAHVEGGCLDPADVAKAAETSGQLSWMLAIQEHVASLAAPTAPNPPPLRDDPDDDEDAMDVSESPARPVPTQTTLTTRGGGEEDEYYYSDEDYTPYPEPALVNAGSGVQPPAPPLAVHLPAYLAPGNGSGIIATDADDDVVLVSRVHRLDLDAATKLACPLCGTVCPTPQVLQVGCGCPSLCCPLCYTTCLCRSTPQACAQNAECDGMPNVKNGHTFLPKTRTPWAFHFEFRSNASPCVSHTDEKAPAEEELSPPTSLPSSRVSSTGLAPAVPAVASPGAMDDALMTATPGGGGSGLYGTMTT